MKTRSHPAPDSHGVLFVCLFVWAIGVNGICYSVMRDIGLFVCFGKNP